MTQGRQCEYIKSDGLQCGGYATQNSTFCFSHNPELREKKREAVVKGGSAQRFAQRVPDIELKNLEDASSVCEKTINEMRAKRITPAEANATMRLVKAWLDTQLLR